MSIIRSPRLESNFSVMSNAVIRDSRLSYRARGVLLESFHALITGAYLVTH
jgi:hypothetical protein